jgi:hypothetical protein
MSLQTIGDTGTTELVKLTPLICVTKSLPPEFPLPPISARPPGLASISKYIDLHLRGEIPPKEVPRGAIVPQSEQFIAHAVIPLPVGWEALEIYPRLKPEYWKPEFASSWARIDLLSVIAQRNAIQSALHQLDSRGATRQHYAKLLEEFEELLSGPEEPCHQFLKAHPELICPTYDLYWSKLPFGDHVSDFVFRESPNDYMLVEIEAPRRELFRRDGHPRQPLTHAISQIRDWAKYIQDNKVHVEQEHGLIGISATPDGPAPSRQLGGSDP